MGGIGSGRRADPVKRLVETHAPIIGPQPESMVLPNLGAAGKNEKVLSDLDARYASSSTNWWTSGATFFYPIDTSKGISGAFLTTDGTVSGANIDQDVSVGSSPTFDAANITGIVTGSVEQLHINIRSASGTIQAGKPVHITSYNAGGWYEVEEADSSDPAKMPAVCLTEVQTTTTATVEGALSGRVTGLNTNSFNFDDPLYVAEGGGLTATRPTGTALVQKIGIVSRKNVAQGVILVIGAGRTNDVPNSFSTSGAITSEGGFSGALFTSGATPLFYTSSQVDHDATTNFVADEHIDWKATSDNLNTSGTISGATITSTGDVSGATVHAGDINLTTLSGAYQTHAADSSDPHGSVLTQTNISGANIQVTGDHNTSGAAFVMPIITDAAATPPTASNFPQGTMYIQYTP